MLAADCVINGQVFAFEPLPANIVSLEKHIELNGLDNVRVLNVAVSDRKGMASFEVGITCADGHLAPNGNLAVQTVSLDELIARQEVPPPNYIKMDIEGGEACALLGARDCFTRFRPELFLATHGKAIHDECCSLLQSWRYRMNVSASSEAERATVHAVPI
jgi:FkbM family methyltransferase